MTGGDILSRRCVLCMQKVYRTHHRIYSGPPSRPLLQQRIQPPSLSDHHKGLLSPLSRNNKRCFQPRRRACTHRGGKPQRMYVGDSRTTRVYCKSDHRRPRWLSLEMPRKSNGRLTLGVHTSSLSARLWRMADRDQGGMEEDNRDHKRKCVRESKDMHSYAG